jgi:RNase H-like domain found in reverse transcriptase
MEDLVEQLIKQNQLLIEELRAQRKQTVVSVDQVTKNLAEQMTTFSYDPEAGLTFEAWYDRYESIFQTEIADWDSPSKIRLLMIKFSQQDYQRFSDSVLPKKPTELTLDDTIKLLKNIFGHRETRFALRHKCFNLRKDDSENFTDFAARINKHGEKFDVTHCTADDLKVLLFVSGLKSPQDSIILEKLLSRVDTQYVALEAAPDDATRALIHKLTLKDLVNEAQRLISLKLDKSTVVSPANSSQEVFAIHQNHQEFKHSNDRNNETRNGTRPGSPQLPKLPKRACSFCGEMHWQRDCPFKEKTCSICSSPGHKNGFCASAFKELTRVYSQNERRRRNSDPAQYSRTSTYHVACSTTASNSQRKFIAPSINGDRICLQLDSASDITIISSENWKKLGKPSLTPIKITPGSASGDQIQLWGSFMSNISFNSKTATGICYVSARLNLLGIDWISALGLWDVPFSTICNAATSKTNRSDLTTESQSLFTNLSSEGLGNKMKASQTLKPGAQSTYRKARPVSLAAKRAIEDEVKRQQHLGVFTQVAVSDFAAPITTVKKKNGKTRIYGDYSTGLNDANEPNKFPLPTPDEIFDELHGKKIYRKIDLSDAFLQVELDDCTKKLLTINTNFGLQQINRLQAGVKTAPGFKQTDKLTLKDVKLERQPKQQETFGKLKQFLASDLILAQLDRNKKIITAADASAYGKGGSIMHKLSGGLLHQINFISSSITAADRNHSQIQREAVALRFTVKHSHKYLNRRHFTLQTDHKLLSTFDSETDLSANKASRAQRYALCLLAFDPDIRYISIDAFEHTHVVSRLIAEHPKEHENTVIATIQLNGEEVNCCAIETASTLPVQFSDIKSATESCSTLKTVINHVNNGWPAEMNKISSKDVANYLLVRNELITIDGYLVHGDRIIISNQFRQQLLSEFLNGHPESARTTKLHAHCNVLARHQQRHRSIRRTFSMVRNAQILRRLSQGIGYHDIIDAYSNWSEIFKTTSTATVRTTQMHQRYV